MARHEALELGYHALEHVAARHVIQRVRRISVIPEEAELHAGSEGEAIHDLLALWIGSVHDPLERVDQGSKLVTGVIAEGVDNDNVFVGNLGLRTLGGRRLVRDGAEGPGAEGSAKDAPGRRTHGFVALLGLAPGGATLRSGLAASNALTQDIDELHEAFHDSANLGNLHVIGDSPALDPLEDVVHDVNGIVVVDGSQQFEQHVVSELPNFRYGGPHSDVIQNGLEEVGVVGQHVTVVRHGPLQLGQGLLHDAGGLEDWQVNGLAEPVESAELHVVPFAVRDQILLTKVVDNLVPNGAEHDPLLNAHVQQAVHVSLELVRIAPQQRLSLRAVRVHETLAAIVQALPGVELSCAEEAGGRAAARPRVGREHLAAEVLGGASEAVANVLHGANVAEVVGESDGGAGEGLPDGVPDGHVDTVDAELGKPAQPEEEAHLDEALSRKVGVIVSELDGGQHHGVDLENVGEEELPGDEGRPEEDVDGRVAEGFVDLLADVETANGKENVEKGLDVIVPARVELGGDDGEHVREGL
mmetsp:Transcript_35837/g.66462  ORF Transcript_35837/g.66462 Transcript_35837/m.66462 type:complete len:529 (-) Transcript_35837:1581-3167(-)